MTIKTFSNCAQTIVFFKYTNNNKFNQVKQQSEQLYKFSVGWKSKNLSNRPGKFPPPPNWCSKSGLG